MIIAIVLLVACFAWVIFSSSDLYLLASYLFGIELNGRDRLMARVHDIYTLSLTYIGHGVGTTHEHLVQIVRTDPTANANALHNDILKYYIDLGCIPAIAFFVNMIVLNTKRFGKISEVSALRYAAFLTLLWICWLTDNLASYPNFLFAYNAILLSLVCEEKWIKDL